VAATGRKRRQRENEQDGRADGVHGSRFLVLELDGDYGQDSRGSHEYIKRYEKKRKLGYVREGVMREGGCVCHMHLAPRPLHYRAHNGKERRKLRAVVG